MRFACCQQLPGPRPEWCYAMSNWLIDIVNQWPNRSSRSTRQDPDPAEAALTSKGEDPGDQRAGVQSVETGLTVLSAFIGAEPMPMLKTITRPSIAPGRYNSAPNRPGSNITSRCLHR